MVQEVSAQSDESAMPSDLVILGAAASQLFECTRDMSREAVVSLLSGLRDVSMRNIPAAGGAVGQAPKLFALNRMVEVLLYNIGRIYDLWAIFLRSAGAQGLCSSCCTWASTAAASVLVKANSLADVRIVVFLQHVRQPVDNQSLCFTPTLQPCAGGDRRPQAPGSGCRN